MDEVEIRLALLLFALVCLFIRALFKNGKKEEAGVICPKCKLDRGAGHTLKSDGWWRTCMNCEHEFFSGEQETEKEKECRAKIKGWADGFENGKWEKT